MEGRETPPMRKYGESKTTRIMMATVPHVTSCSGLRKIQADEFLFESVPTHSMRGRTLHWLRESSLLTSVVYGRS